MGLLIIGKIIVVNKIRIFRGESVKAKEILQEYSRNLKRVAMLEYDLKCIDNQTLIKVTDYSQDHGGNCGGIVDKYWRRIEEKKMI